MGTEVEEGAVTGDERDARGHGMGSDKHVHGGEFSTPFPGGGADIRISLCSSGIPGKDTDTEEKLMDEFGEAGGIRFERETEEQFGFGDGRDAHLNHGNAAQTFADTGRISL